jgi:hypothetical protein
MVGLITGPDMLSSDARQVLQDLFITEADILPDSINNRLRVRVHNASRPATNRVLHQLFEKLNQAEMKYPGTDLKLFYELRGGFP